MVEAESPARLDVETLEPDRVSESGLPAFSNAATDKPADSSELVEPSEPDWRSVYDVYETVKCVHFEAIRQWVSVSSHLSALLREAILDKNFAMAKVIMKYGIEKAMQPGIRDHGSHVAWLLEEDDEELLIFEDSSGILDCMVDCFRYYTLLVSREYQFTP